MPILTGFVLLCFLVALLKTVRILTPHRPVSFLKLSVHYLSSLSLLAVVYFVGQITLQPEHMFYYLGLFCALLISYARYIEPKLIQVHHHRIEFVSPHTSTPLRLALLSDLHIGIFTHPRQIRRIIKKLDGMPIDAVLIAGDLTYEPTVRQLTRAFLPFRQLNVPIFAVLGNHDEEVPGPRLNSLLREALEAAHIQVIENQMVPLHGYKIYGAGDLWANKTSFSRLTDNEPAIILAHHPRTAHHLPPDQGGSLLLTGHTHGGQIRIPLLSRTLIKNRILEGFLNGEYQYLNHRIFVSRGIGTVGIPFRLGTPPTIDIMEINH